VLAHSAVFTVTAGNANGDLTMLSALIIIIIIVIIDSHKNKIKACRTQKLPFKR